ARVLGRRGRGRRDRRRGGRLSSGGIGLLSDPPPQAAATNPTTTTSAATPPPLRRPRRSADDRTEPTGALMESPRVAGAGTTRRYVTILSSAASEAHWCHRMSIQRAARAVRWMLRSARRAA